MEDTFSIGSARVWVRLLDTSKSRLSAFLAEQRGGESAKPQGLIVDAALVCQTCFLQCDEGEYFPNEKLLIWNCPNNHQSYAEDFQI